MPNKKNIFSFALMALFLAPILSLFFYLRQIENPFDADFFSVFILSLAQALLSASLALIFGFFGALGLVGVENRKLRRLFDLILLGPNFVPVLLILVSTLNLFVTVMRFPFGFWGVVILHVLVNTGLAAVLIARQIENQTGGVIEVATVEGASRTQIVRAVARELTGDLVALFYFLFVLCFTSFSVPLVVGARSGRTLETLIYEKLIGHHQIGAALALSVIQIGFLLVVAHRVFAPTNSLDRYIRQTKRVASWPILIILILVSLALVGGAIRGGFVGFLQLGENQNLLSRLTSGILGSALECALVSIAVLSIGLVECLAGARSISNHFFRAFIAPSTAVIGLVFVVFFAPETWSPVAVIALISVGFALLIFPTLFRMRLAPALTALQPQIETAQVLGASATMILRSITLPILRRDLAFIAGLAAFWASGDFAFASMVAGHDVTLAVSAHSLLGGYRVEVATAITFLSLAVGAVFFLGYEWFAARGADS